MKGWVSIKYLRIVNNSNTKKNSRYISGDNGDTEYDSGAEVCISVTNASIRCHESIMGNYYDRCNVTVDYEINTNYSGDDYIDTSIECEVQVKSKTKDGYFTKTQYESDSNSYSLYANDYTSDSMDLNFRFSNILDETISVKISDVECRINNLYKY